MAALRNELKRSFRRIKKLPLDVRGSSAKHVSGTLMNHHECHSHFSDSHLRYITGLLASHKHVLSKLVAGEMDKHKTNAFAAWQVEYWKAGLRWVSKNGSIGRTVQGFNETEAHEFFRLGEYLHDHPRLRLGKKKKNHKWGVLSLLPKSKVWKKVFPGEILCWADLKFLPTAA